MVDVNQILSENVHIHKRCNVITLTRSLFLYSACRHPPIKAWEHLIQKHLVGIVQLALFLRPFIQLSNLYCPLQHYVSPFHLGCAHQCPLNFCLHLLPPRRTHKLIHSNTRSPKYAPWSHYYLVSTPKLLTFSNN